MKKTNFKVENRIIEQLDMQNIVGAFNVDTFHFDFDDEWSNLNKTLVLIVAGKTYNVAMLNNEAVLPNEVYNKDKVQFGVYGKNENTILATALSEFYLYESSYKEGIEPSNIPTPTQWDLYVAEINNLLNESKLTKEECERILAELKEFANQSIAEINTLKEQVNQTVQEFDENAGQKLKEYNDNAEEKENNLNEIAEDVRDMASALTFATFDVEPTEGALYVNSAESLGNMGFSVENDGEMYVEIPKKEVS